jgi:hypothetical protein
MTEPNRNRPPTAAQMAAEDEVKRISAEVILSAAGLTGPNFSKIEEVLLRLRAENPKANKKKLLQLFKREVATDPELSDACVEFAVNRVYQHHRKALEKRRA